MGSGEKRASAGEERAGLVRIEQRFAAGQGKARQARVAGGQIVELVAPRERMLAVVRKSLLVGVEAEEAVAMAVVREGERAACARARACDAAGAQAAERHARPSVANARAHRPQPLHQSMRLLAHVVARSERHARLLEGPQMLGLYPLVQLKRGTRSRIVVERRHETPFFHEPSARPSRPPQGKGRARFSPR